MSVTCSNVDGVIFVPAFIPLDPLAKGHILPICAIQNTGIKVKIKVIHCLIFDTLVFTCNNFLFFFFCVRVSQALDIASHLTH